MIHRLCSLNPDFKGFCEDYEEADAAMLRWDACGFHDRAEEYRVIMLELEADIIRLLNAQPGRQLHRGKD